MKKLLSFAFPLDNQPTKKSHIKYNVKDIVNKENARKAQSRHMIGDFKPKEYKLTDDMDVLQNDPMNIYGNSSILQSDITKPHGDIMYDMKTFSNNNPTLTNGDHMKARIKDFSNDVEFRSLKDETKLRKNDQINIEQLVPRYKESHGYGPDYGERSEGFQHKLDIFTGSDNLAGYKHKREAPALFSPEESREDIHKEFNYTTVNQSRVVPSRFKTGELLMEPVRQTKGANLGYNKNATHGHHEMYRPPQRTINDLRTENNKRVDYIPDVTKGADSRLVQRGILGESTFVKRETAIIGDTRKYTQKENIVKSRLDTGSHNLFKSSKVPRELPGGEGYSKSVVTKALTTDMHPSNKNSSKYSYETNNGSGVSYLTSGNYVVSNTLEAKVTRKDTTHSQSMNTGVTGNSKHILDGSHKNYTSFHSMNGLTPSVNVKTFLKQGVFDTNALRKTIKETTLDNPVHSASTKIGQYTFSTSNREAFKYNTVHEDRMSKGVLSKGYVDCKSHRETQKEITQGVALGAHKSIGGKTEESHKHHTHNFKQTNGTGVNFVKPGGLTTQGSHKDTQKELLQQNGGGAKHKNSKARTRDENHKLCNVKNDIAINSKYTGPALGKVERGLFGEVVSSTCKMVHEQPVLADNYRGMHPRRMVQGEMTGVSQHVADKSDALVNNQSLDMMTLRSDGSGVETKYEETGNKVIVENTRRVDVGKLNMLKHAPLGIHDNDPQRNFVLNTSMPSGDVTMG